MKTIPGRGGGEEPSSGAKHPGWSGSWVGEVWNAARAPRVGLTTRRDETGPGGWAMKLGEQPGFPGAGSDDDALRFGSR